MKFFIPYLFANLIYVVLSLTKNFDSFYDLEKEFYNSKGSTKENNYLSYFTGKNIKTNSTLDILSNAKYSSIKDELIEELIKFLALHSNITITTTDFFKNEECSKFLNKSDAKYLYYMINNSGKSLSDIGLQSECESVGLFYLFLEFRVNLEVFMNKTEHYYLYRFLDQNTFFNGFCLPKECMTFYKNFLDPKKNIPFFNYIKTEYGIEQISTYLEKNKNDITYCYIVAYVLIIYISLKLCISILGFFIFKLPGDSLQVSTGERENALDDSDSMSSEDGEKNTSEELIFSKRKISNSSKSKYFSKFKYTFFVIYKFVSIKSHIKYLNTLKNKYYDDTGLEYISFFRAFIFFWLIFNHNVYALVKIPHRDFTNYSFFTNIWFSIIKYSTFSADCWIMLDGLVTSYKLMNYLKKHNEKRMVPDYSFKVFFRFYLIIFTRFCLFFFVFYVIHVKVEDFSSILGENPIYSYFIKSINNQRYCQQQPWDMLIPFKVQYLSFTSTVDSKYAGYSNCYRFTNIYFNEFYCFTFIILIFYLSYKFRSKFFDYAVALAIFINILLMFLSYQNSYYEGKVYSFSWVLGETIGSKYTHLFLNTYMMGIFTGLIYFYFNDVISGKPLDTDYYIPFRFCFTIMIIFDRSGKLMKKAYYYISVFIQIILSMSFYFYIMIYSPKKTENNLYNFYTNSDGPENDFCIKINPLMNFFYIYERKIFLFFFILMILSILLTSKVTSMKLFVTSNIFIPFSRKNFASLCILDTCVYMFYSLYNTQIFLNLSNIFLIAVGLLILISLLSYFLLILFELPFRILYKKMIRSSEKK